MKRILQSLILIIAFSPLFVLAQSSYSDSDVPLILPRAVWESASSVNGLLDWMPEDKDAQSFQGGNPNNNNAIPDYAPIERIVIHDAGCSLSSPRCNGASVDPISVIQSIYRNHAKTRGWGDIGYHYIIDRKGVIYEGRYGGNGVRGAHVYDSKNCRNFNVGTIGIVLLGNHTNTQPSEAVATALAKLVGWLSATNGLDPSDMNKTAPIWTNPKSNNQCDASYGGFSQSFTGPVVLGHNEIELANSDPGILDMSKVRSQAIIWKEKYAGYFYQGRGDESVLAITGGAIGKIADNISLLSKDDASKVKKINDSQMALFPENNKITLPGGSLVQSRTRNDIYIIESGKRRHISSARLFQSLGYSLANVKILSDRDLLGYAKGDPVAYPDGSLLASEKDGKVYLIKNSRKRYIVSSKAFKNNKFKEKDIIKIPETDLDAYSYGGIVGDLPEGMLISISSKTSAPNYVIIDGGKRLISSWEMFDRWKFSKKKIKVLSKKEFEVYPDQGELYYPDNTVIYEAGQLDRYLVYGGKKYWIANYDAFIALGLNTHPTAQLTAKEFAQYPTGTKIASVGDWQEVLHPGLKSAIVVVAPTEKSVTTNNAVIPAVYRELMRVGLFSVEGGDIIKITADKDFKVKTEKGGEADYRTGEIASISWAQSGNTKFTSNQGAIFTVKSHDLFNWNKSVNFNTFRGNLELIYSSVSRKIWLVNELPFEEYLQGIGEALNSDRLEYQKAFAVSARSYALFHLQNGGKYGKNEVFYLNNSSSDQVYKGYAWEQYAPKLVSAVQATIGEVMKYNGKVARSVYSSDSGGTTKNACVFWGGEFCGTDYGYLVGGVKDPEGTARRDAASQKASHGVGMSATGARRLAELGKTYKEILAYYYKDIRAEKIY